jgi:hypothetical protein
MFAQSTDAERARERRLHANDSDEVEDDDDDDVDEGQDFDEDEDEEEADAEDDDLSAYLASLPEEEQFPELKRIVREQAATIALQGQHRGFLSSLLVPRVFLLV